MRACAPCHGWQGEGSYVFEGAKLGQVAQPLRAALTGRSTSPGIFDVLETLGREESLGRISDQAA